MSARGQWQVNLSWIEGIHCLLKTFPIFANERKYCFYPGGIDSGTERISAFNNL